MNGVDSAVIKKKKGATSFVYSIIKSIFWGLLIGVIINCIMWHFEGYKRLMEDLIHTYQTQMTGVALRNEGAAVGFGALAGMINDVIKTGENKVQGLISESDYLHSATDNKKAKSIGSKIWGALDHFILVVSATFEVLIAKFLSIFVSVWVFVFASILGAMDGLLERFIRTSEGGRESTFIFHRVSDTMIKVPVAIVFFYLTIPLFFNPELIVVFMSILFFMFFYIATANLKKFL